MLETYAHENMVAEGLLFWQKLWYHSGARINLLKVQDHYFKS